MQLDVQEQEIIEDQLGKYEIGFIMVEFIGIKALFADKCVWSADN